MQCAGAHVVELAAARCTDNQISTFCSTRPSASSGFHCWGAISSFASPVEPNHQVLGEFSDGKQAVVRTVVANGTSVHFMWLPGLSHIYEAATGPDPRKERVMPVPKINIFPGNSTGTRAVIESVFASILADAGVDVPVRCSKPHIETPLLEGPRGAVVTVLNWAYRSCWDEASVHAADLRCEPFSVQLNVSLSFVPTSVLSAEHGALTRRPERGSKELNSWTVMSGFVQVWLSLDSADFISFYR